MSPLGAMLWAKRRIARHTLASVRRESKLKVAVVSTSAVLLWIGLFAAGRWGFDLFETLGAELFGGGSLSLGDLLAGRLLSLFALALFVMLVFSSLLIAFTTLYRSAEVPFLVQAPISTATFFLGRFYEVVVFSSWASAYLGSAALLAYGLETGAPWGYYLALPAFFVPFVTLPAAIGALLAVLLAPLLARLGRGWLAAAAALVATALFAFFRGEALAPGFGPGAGLRTLAEALGTTGSPFLPSSWLSRGVLAAATGRAGEATFHLLLLAANALFAVYLATLAADALFHRGWSALAGAGERRPGRRSRTLLGRLDGLLRPLPQPLRALVAKDVKLFWRDPAQWSQFVLFFGIMALYVAGLDGGRQAAADELWRGWVALLNLAASMLILATLTTRFVFPLVSLEGRRLWILGLAPLSLRQVVWQKLWLSVATTSVFTVTLAVISGWRLQLEGTVLALSVAAIGATTLALSGLAVGLGSLYPSFQEDNPARIVSGLGGTLSFLLSMVYVVLMVTALAAVFHWPRLEPHLGEGAYAWVLAAVAAWIAGWTLAAWLVPMHLGLRHLERVEL